MMQLLSRTPYAPPARDEADAGTLAHRASTPRFEVGFASEREERRVLDWLNAGLRPGRPGRLRSEYPFLFEKESLAIPITAYAEDSLVAFCMLWPTPFRLGQGTLRMGLISLVYTDPAHRGQGYASETLRKAMDEARTRSIGCVALWSDLDPLYTSLGFLPSGSESLLALDAGVIDRAFSAESPAEVSAPFEITPPGDSDWLAIERLRSERICTHALHLAPETLNRVPEMHVRVARRADRLVSFAIRGRGDDFPGVIHEWGGEASGVLRCCQALIQTEPLLGASQLLSSKDPTKVTSRLRAAGATVQRRPLAWFQLADLTAFTADLAACCGVKTAWRISMLRPESFGENFLRIQSAYAETTISLQHFLDACFGASTTAPEEAALKAIAPLLIKEEGENTPSLPLPFFISGLESI